MEAHGCCSNENLTSKSSSCSVCGSQGKKVLRLTLEHLLKRELVPAIGESPYYFCETPACEVVYFNHEEGSYFRKTDLQVRVGIKETEDPIPICYCFDYTERMVLDEIREKGYTTIPDRIRREIKAGNCACESKNPSGACCLGHVTKVAKKGLSQRQPV